MQVARQQRPLLKGVPRQWRGMYTAGGASTNVDTAYKDFWYLCWLRQRDTYPTIVVAPLSKGDAAAVTFDTTFVVPTLK